MKTNKSDTYKNLADNIKTLRKKKSMTQEKLAEALGVTTGAVYKWESAQSVPEITLMMELAEIFEVSVDALLGFEIKNDSLEQTIERINCLIESRRWQDALVEIDNGLLRYPNNFDLFFQEANVCRMIFYEHGGDKAMLTRSTECFKKAQILVAFGSTRKQARINLHKEIAMNYLLQKQDQKAIETLIDNNICGVNNSIIGQIYVYHMKDAKSAKPFLAEAMMKNIEETVSAALGYARTLHAGHDSGCLDCLEWLIDYLDSLKVDKESVAEIDKVKTAIMAYLSGWNLEFSRRENAFKLMEDTIELAKKFDAASLENMSKVRFVDDPAFFALDDVGKTAKGAVEKVLFTEKEDLKKYKELHEMWIKADFN